MGKDLNDYTKEELIDLVGQLKKRKKFGLVWEDKPEKVVEECQEKLPVLEEVESKAIEKAPNKPTNLIIEGDNYHALSVLNYTHAGKIDVIYIDPPYNTENREFIYNDFCVDKQDPFRHSKWLSFMKKRLQLAKQLLSYHGVIFISIDDNEQAQLKMLCDEIFGNNNFLGCIIQEKGNAQNDAKNIQKNHDYHLVYCKNRLSIGNKEQNIICQIKTKIDKPKNINGVKYIFKQKLDAPTKNPKLKQRPGMGSVIYYHPETKDLLARDDYDPKKALVSDDENEVYHFNQDLLQAGYQPIIPSKFKGELGRWRWKGQTINQDRHNLIIYKNRPQIVERVDGEKTRTLEQPLKSVIQYATSAGTVTLSEILKQDAFDNPKNLQMLKYFIGSSQKSDFTVLDFFAGSGTIGQAVLELNQEDGGNRQFILVTNNEANGKKDAGEEGIARKVTYPRIKTVITGIRPDGSKYSDGIPANVRYFKTDFVEKGDTTDDTREALIEKASDMIRIRENAFDLVKHHIDYKLYKNDQYYVAIIFNQFEVEGIWREIEKLDVEKLPVHVYMFSYTRHANEEEIPEDTELEWEAKAIPEGVLRVYERIFNKGGKR